MKRSRRILMHLVSISLVLGCLQGGCASEAAQPETQPPIPAEPLSTPLPPQSAEELDQLVAPIALYPDALVAQILAAASHPTEIVEADRWLQQNPDLKGDVLAKAVDSQSWDPAVKALTQFPGLLGMMDKNLSWTSSLGEAYVNGQKKCPRRGTGDASASTTGREPEEHAAGIGHESGKYDRHSTGRPANRLCAGVRSLARLR